MNWNVKNNQTAFVIGAVQKLRKSGKEWNYFILDLRNFWLVSCLMCMMSLHNAFVHALIEILNKLNPGRVSQISTSIKI